MQTKLVNRFYSAWLIGLLAAAPAVAQPTDAQTDTRNWAEKMFDEAEHDFGTVASGADVRHRLRIKNIYQETVTISNVGTTCGCTAAEATHKELKTGEEAFIEIQMNTVKFRREKTSNVDVTLTFNGREFKTVRIPIRAYIRPDVVLTPGNIELGSVEVGTGAQRRIQIAYAGRDDWTITGVEAPSEFITAELTETLRGNGRVNYDLLVTLAPEAPLGTLDEQLTLKIDDEKTPEVMVGVNGAVVPDIVVNPSALSLGNLAPGATKTMTVVVRGRRPFAIEAIECESDRECFKIRLNKDERSVHVLPLTVTAPAEEGEFTETFYVTIPGREEPVTFTAQGMISARG